MPIFAGLLAGEYQPFCGSYPPLKTTLMMILWCSVVGSAFQLSSRREQQSARENSERHGKELLENQQQLRTATVRARKVISENHFLQHCAVKMHSQLQ